jgi:hypothetical protein
MLKATLEVGKMHRDGLGTPQAIETAITFFRR